MEQKVRVGFIGCGGIGRRHVNAFASMDEAEVVALTDPDPARIAGYRQRCPELRDAPAFDDYRKMIEQVELDATCICSPHFAHYEQIVDSLRAGLHVLTEKPMVCTIEHARSVMEQESAAGKLVAIAYQRHCEGQYQFVRKAIESGQAGEVKFVTAFQGQEWLHSQKGKWRQVWELSCGGQLNDSGSHLIDIILWMTGLAVEEVSAGIDNCGTEVDINSALSFRFKNGALGTLSVVGACPVGFWEDITIVCEKWAFFLRKGELTYSTGIGGEMHRVDGFKYAVRGPADNFVDAVLGRAEVQVPAICGLRVIELTEAAWASAKTGRPVKV